MSWVQDAPAPFDGAGNQPVSYCGSWTSGLKHRNSKNRRGYTGNRKALSNMSLNEGQWLSFPGRRYQPPTEVNGCDSLSANGPENIAAEVNHIHDWLQLDENAHFKSQHTKYNLDDASFSKTTMCQSLKDQESGDHGGHRSGDSYFSQQIWHSPSWQIAGESHLDQIGQVSEQIKQPTSAKRGWEGDLISRDDPTACQGLFNYTSTQRQIPDQENKPGNRLSCNQNERQVGYEEFSTPLVHDMSPKQEYEAGGSFWWAGQNHESLYGPFTTDDMNIWDPSLDNLGVIEPRSGPALTSFADIDGESWIGRAVPELPAPDSRAYPFLDPSLPAWKLSTFDDSDGYWASDTPLMPSMEMECLDLPNATTFQPSPVSTRKSPVRSSQRDTARDELLIRCKNEGMSYKDIKALGSFEEAESTLRGRFRTLTKPKEQRVRKPEWRESDVSRSNCHREALSSANVVEDSPAPRSRRLLHGRWPH